MNSVAGLPPSKVIEAHGSFDSASCTRCKTTYPTQDVKVRDYIYMTKILAFQLGNAPFRAFVSISEIEKKSFSVHFEMHYSINYYQKYIYDFI